MQLLYRAREIGDNMGLGLVAKLGTAWYDYRVEGSIVLVRVAARLPCNGPMGSEGSPVDQFGRWHVIEAYQSIRQIENTHYLATKLFIEHEHAELIKSASGGTSPYYPRH